MAWSFRESLGAVAGQSPIVLPGLYAWLTTVAVPAGGPTAGGWARGTAGLGLMALLAAPLLLRTQALLARVVGIYGFVGMSVATWLLVDTRIAAERIEPVRAALGALGWAVFAFGWGRLRDRHHVPEDDPRVIPGPPLPPRSKLPAGASVVFALAVVVALLPVFLAWRVDRPAQALLAHTAALIAAIATLVAGSAIATDRGRRDPVAPSERIRRASRTLMLLGALCTVGLLFGLLF